MKTCFRGGQRNQGGARRLEVARGERGLSFYRAEVIRSLWEIRYCTISQPLNRAIIPDKDVSGDCLISRVPISRIEFGCSELVANSFCPAAQSPFHPGAETKNIDAIRRQTRGLFQRLKRVVIVT